MSHHGTRKGDPADPRLPEASTKSLHQEWHRIHLRRNDLRFSLAPGRGATISQHHSGLVHLWESPEQWVLCLGARWEKGTHEIGGASPGQRTRISFVANP